MYWSNWMKSQPRLERANLDGSGRIALFSDIGRVNGLTIDFGEQRLYWANIDHHVIESASLSGGDR